MQFFSTFFLLMVLCVNAVQAQATLSKPLADVAEYPSRSASATALSLNNTLLSAQIVATVSELNVKVSQKVTKGQSLVVLDCADYRLNLEMAKARLDSAEAQLALADNQLRRSKQLFNQSLTSQEQLDTRFAERVSQNAMVKQCQVKLRQEQLNVSRCEVKAPFDGVVTDRLASVGQLANIGTPVLSLVESGNVELSAKVSYEDAEYFSAVKAFVFDYRQQVPVSVSEIGIVVDPNTRNLEVRFSFPEQRPLAGTAGKLIWNDPRPYIPADLIVKRGGRLGVFIDENGRANFLPLKNSRPGRPVLTDLPLDTLLVVAGLSVMQDGDQIKAR